MEWSSANFRYLLMAAPYPILLLGAHPSDIRDATWESNPVREEKTLVRLGHKVHRGPSHEVISCGVPFSELIEPQPAEVISVHINRCINVNNRH